LLTQLHTTYYRLSQNRPRLHTILYALSHGNHILLFFRLESAAVSPFYSVYYVNCALLSFFFFKQKTAYEIVDCDWSSDVCSSDLHSL